MKLIIGVDPGLAATGIACVACDGTQVYEVSAHVIQTKCADDRSEVEQLGTRWIDIAGSAYAFIEKFVNACCSDEVTFEYGRGCRSMVIEVSKVRKRGKGDDSDLVSVGGAAGGIAVRCNVAPHDVHCVRPETWKGQTPKEVTARRVKEEVTARRVKEEVPSLDLSQIPRGLRHNAIDAVGIALYWIRYHKYK